MLVAMALANKMARSVWAMLTKKEDYRDLAAWEHEYTLGNCGAMMGGM